MKTPTEDRYHATDGWRGYTIPALAVAGSSMTDEGGPAPPTAVRRELLRLRAVFDRAGILTDLRQTESSNVFMVKAWLCVHDPEDFRRGAKLATDWLDEHHADTDFIHSADLEKLGYRPTAEDVTA